MTRPQYGWTCLAVLTVVVGSLFLFWIPAPQPDRSAVSPNSPSVDASNTSSAGFLGSSACAECHAKIAESYRSSGMGRSLLRIEDASHLEDAAAANTFSPDERHHYSVERNSDGVFHRERQTDQSGQTIYDQAVKIDYVMGSGNQGRSYLIDRGGLLFMSPIGWYGRAGRWDLSPGYKLPTHQRFERLVTEGCLDCHTGQMNVIAGRENRFQQPPFREQAIGCERCHGAGQDHVQFHRGNSTVGPDPIINPARLDPSRREDVCNQCHLQGEGRYPHDGCQFGDFRPGQRLEDVYVVLVQGTRATADGQTQAVSQVEQMRSSACFKQSQGRFGCTSCHDPHSQPPRARLDSYYRAKCLTCHNDRGCSLPEPDRLNRQANDSCIACHLPPLSASDVPHTSQTDHRILRSPKDFSKVDRPTTELPELFDGAEQRLPRVVTDRGRGIWLAEQADSKSDPQLAGQASRMLALVLRQKPNDAHVLNAMGTAASVAGQTEDALTYWKQALAIDPHRELTLRSIAVMLQKLGRHIAARPVFEEYLQVQPWNAGMWNRYSHVLAQLGEVDRAIDAAKKSIEIDPSNAGACQWLAEIYSRKGDQEQRRYYQELFERLRDNGPR